MVAFLSLIMIIYAESVFTNIEHIDIVCQLPAYIKHKALC